MTRFLPRARSRRAPKRALPKYTPPAAPVVVRSSPSAHVVSQTGLRCACGELAMRWTRCGVCRALLTTCGDHPQTFTQQRAAHAATHPAAPGSR